MRQNLDKEHLLRLTLAVYKVTAIFPVEEELSFKIRESADSILFELLRQAEQLVAPPGGATNIDSILGLLDLAERKNWVDPRNFLVLRREYEKVGHAMSIGHRMSNSGTAANCNGQNNHRQEKILEVMNGNGMVKIGDLIKLLPGVNRRTVLRDLDKLCQAGAAVRNGNGRGAHYVKNGH